MKYAMDASANVVCIAVVWNEIQIDTRKRVEHTNLHVCVDQMKRAKWKLSFMPGCKPQPKNLCCAAIEPVMEIPMYAIQEETLL